MRSLRIAIPLTVLGAAVGHAQTYTVNGISPITAFGEVAAGESGDTIFFQNNTTVSVDSGSGARIKGTVRRATVTIRCAGSGNPNTCGILGNNARIIVGNVSSTGRAKPFSQFIATAGTGAISGTTTGSTLDFVMSGFTGTGNKTFLLDTRMPVAGDDAGGATGALTNIYYVYVAKDPTVPTTGLTAAATITVRRALRMAKNSDLRFGSLVKRASGSGNVVIASASDNTRTVSGTAPPLEVPAGGGLDSGYGRAKFTISGEPGTTYAISYSPTGNVTMNNQSGAGSLSVTMAKTATGNQTMGGTGQLILGVGGTITVNSATAARGVYTGSFTVTVTYN